MNTLLNMHVDTEYALALTEYAWALAVYAYSYCVICVYQANPEVNYDSFL